MRGTTSILNSVLKHGSTTKRVVLTSSVAAVREDTTVPRIFTESSWNNAAIEAVETKGPAAGPGAFYKASKTLAEKAAWEFVAAHKSEISWDLIVLNPPWLFGASLHFLFLFISLLRYSLHRTLFYSLRSAPRRLSTTSTPLNAKSMTPFLARGKVSNCGIKETGCTWPWRRRRMCALRARLLLAARGSSSDPDPSFTRTCVS